jgi:MFS superfamily sulfate permease-like transporter
VGIVATDLLKGVMIGLGLALAKIVWMFTHLRIRVERSAPEKTTTVWLEGSATFVRLPELTAALASVTQGDDVHIHFVGLNHVDHASFDALAAWEKQHLARGGRVFLNWREVEFLAQRPDRVAKDSNRPPAMPSGDGAIAVPEAVSAKASEQPAK